MIIKLLGRSIGYHYLWRRIQAMWHTSVELLMIDLSNNFYIIKLFGCEEYDRAMSEGPQMIRDNYLHVQKWRPNFSAEDAKILTLQV